MQNYPALTESKRAILASYLLKWYGMKFEGKEYDLGGEEWGEIATQFFQLPTSIQIQLQMGQIHETLVQDTNRWLGDNYNHYLELDENGKDIWTNEIPLNKEILSSYIKNSN